MKRHEVELEAPLQLCSLENFRCKAIVFFLKELETSGSVVTSQRPNAFDILMNSQRRRILPKKVTGDKLRADQKLYNDVIDLLASWDGGWAADSVQTIGERCVKTITSALWYLDPHHQRFKERSLSIPPCFAKFNGFNNWKQKKERQPKLHQVDLDRHVQSLSSILCQPWSHKPHHKTLRSNLVLLVDVMKQYCNYLKQHNDSMQAAHSSGRQHSTRHVCRSVTLSTATFSRSFHLCHCMIQYLLMITHRLIDTSANTGLKNWS